MGTFRKNTLWIIALWKNGDGDGGDLLGDGVGLLCDAVDHLGDGVDFPQSQKPFVKRGGGYHPFPVRKNPLKIDPKTVYLGRKTVF